MLVRIYLLFIILVGLSCKKDWLEAKPKLSMVVPSTIEDYQALLDNSSSGFSKASVPFNDLQSSFDEIGAGDFFTSDAVLEMAQPIERNVYTWSSDIFAGATNFVEWETPYKRILSTNIILEGINSIEPQNATEKTAWNNVKGSAFFFRAYSHYNIAQLFAPQYEEQHANSLQGIPLRVSSDISTKVVRAALGATYEQIIEDLKQALSLLPVETPINNVYKMRPTKVAANAMLARVYLSMNAFDSAYKYANKTLQLYDKLMDYNSLIVEDMNPIPQFNNEVILYNMLSVYLVSHPDIGLNVDTTLLASYSFSDLRKSVFFMPYGDGRNFFKGSYWGFYYGYFSGLATDEIYLIRAECNARKGNTFEAMNDLNVLLKKRWETGKFEPLNATDSDDALVQIIQERRKELCFRGIRWSDLKRLNKEPRFAVTLKRVVNGKTFELAPNDKKYVLPIPPNVVELSGIQQNPR